MFDREGQPMGDTLPSGETIRSSDCVKHILRGQHGPEQVIVRQPVRLVRGLGAILGRSPIITGTGTHPALARVQGAGTTRNVLYEVTPFVTTVLVGPRSTPQWSSLCSFSYPTNMYRSPAVCQALFYDALVCLSHCNKSILNQWFTDNRNVVLMVLESGCPS